MALWCEFQLLRDQLEKLINAKNSSSSLIVMKGAAKLFFHTRLMHEKEVRRYTGAQSRKLVTDNNLMIDGKAYIATSLTGVELSEAIIMAVLPKI